MALMDLIGLGADKQAVVLDIGSAYTRIGFAGEFVPRHIIPTELTNIEGGNLVKSKLFEKPASEQFKAFRDFFHTIYFKYLLVNPKERRVVICDSILKPVRVRNLIAEVLFKHFEVVSICFVPSHLLALLALGLKTGLVIDCGYEETTVVPIFEQIPILGAMEYIGLAGKAVHAHLHTQLMEKGIVQVGNIEKLTKSELESIDERVIEEIKVQLCFVGRMDYDKDAVAVKYPLNGSQILNVSGRVRTHTMDLLFKENEDSQSLCTIILDALVKCPIDCRKALIENIVVVGGTSMAPGFQSRLYAELKRQLSTEPYNTKLFTKNITFQTAPLPSNYVIWQGGALFGALEILNEQSISKERYSVDPAIPDWSSVLALSTETNTSKSFLDDKYKWASLRKTLPTSSAHKVSASPSASERLRKELGLS